MLRGSNTTRRATWLAGLAVTAALAVAGCSSSGSSAPVHVDGAVVDDPGERRRDGEPQPRPGTSLGGKPAPDVKLVNQFGQQMSLSQFRGRVVMLSFEDSECTTVCPLTTQSMVLAKELLGKAGNSVQLLGVDANPDAIKVADVMDYSRVARHGQPVGLPDRLARPAEVGVEGLQHRRADRVRPDRPHARAVRHRSAGQAAEGLPDPDGVLERHPVRAGPGHRGGEPAAQPPEAEEP